MIEIQKVGFPLFLPGWEEEVGSDCGGRPPKLGGFVSK